jgi:lipoprotein-anchoring transpeptidase ErfK/SrfK
MIAPGRRGGARAGAAGVALPPMLAAALLAGCVAGPSSPAGAGGGGPLPTASRATTSPAVGEDTVAARDRPQAVVAVRDVAALAEPGGAVVAIFPARQPWGDPTVFLLDARRADAAGTAWYRVLLPGSLPGSRNGSTGWVRADAVRLEPRPVRVEVDLSARRLLVLDGRRVLRRSRVAIGAPATPTPTGRYFVTAKLRPPRISPVFGPWALALSAYSDVLDQFGTGDGQIGLHGTAATGELGRAVSHGCLRVDHRTVTDLARLLPTGTQVTVVA